MALSEQIAAYVDCYEVYERAEQSKVGIRVRHETRNEAWNFQLRMNKARVLDRRENSRVYELSHPLHGKSSYDHFRVRNAVEDTNGFWWVFIEPWESAGKYLIEDLEPDETYLVDVHRETLLIEDHREDSAND